MRDPRLTLLLFLCFGCHASVQAQANAGTSGQSDADLEAEVQKERATPAPEPMLAASGPAPTLAVDKPLLGARAGLTLVPAEATATCSCLRVGLGSATSPAFHWEGDPPAVDSQTQLVVAFTSEGTGCKDPKGSIGASYWGYKHSGDDVVVYVENGVEGRPLMTGAIIPKPFGSGQVYVSPITKQTGYGSAPGGKGRCKIGNPGPPRTAPVTQGEMGAGDTPEAASAGDMLSDP